MNLIILMFFFSMVCYTHTQNGAERNGSNDSASDVVKNEGTFPFQAQVTTIGDTYRHDTQQAEKSRRSSRRRIPSTTPANLKSKNHPSSPEPRFTEECKGGDKTDAYTEDFYDLMTRGKFFVDKSLFISEFLSSGDETTQITRPSRWGKSTNVNMLQRFLEIETDKRGNLIPRNESVNRILFHGGEITLQNGTKKMLSPLKITRYPNITEAYQGQYPVIYISFADIQCRVCKDFEDEFKIRVQKLYQKYSYLRAKLYPESLKTWFDYYLKNTASTSYDLWDSLKLLSEIVHDHYEKGVFIFVEDYDAPIEYMYGVLEPKAQSRNSASHQIPEFYGTWKLVSRIMENTFINNRNLKQGLITGIFPLDKSAVCRGFDRLVELNVLDKKYTTSFGFTQSEVNDLVEMVPGADADGMKRMYGGYVFATEKLYNPWSVRIYLQTLQFRNYWIDSRNTGLVDRRLHAEWFKKDLTKLAHGERIRARVSNNITFDQFGTRMGFLNILLYSGYLTPIHVKSSILHIPNEEVSYLYEDPIEIGTWCDE